jgi:RNAse (barnase) inhibitor barstar
MTEFQEVLAVDCRSISTLKDLYDILSSNLPMPSYFSRNLDSLDEILNDGLLFEGRNLEIYFQNSEHFLNKAEEKTRLAVYEIFSEVLSNLNAKSEDISANSFSARSLKFSFDDLNSELAGYFKKKDRRNIDLLTF